MSTQNSVRLLLLGTLPGFVTSINQGRVKSAKTTVEHTVVVLLQHFNAFLDAVDEPIWLPPVVKVLLEVNQLHPMLLLPHFVHVVDLLIGWLTKTNLDSESE